MSVAYGTGDKGKATKLHSQIIRSIGYCEKCGYHCSCENKWQHNQYCKLQAAHIQGRKASATRTLVINAFSLCASDHAIFTDKPLSFSRWVTTTWAQEFRDELIRLSFTPTKVNWTTRLAELVEYKRRLLSGATLQEIRLEEAMNL